MMLFFLGVLAIVVATDFFYFLSLIDDLKTRIDRVVEDNRWQNEQIARLMKRVNKLEDETSVKEEQETKNE